MKVLYGGGNFTYELVDGWAKCPEPCQFVDIGGLSIDSHDRVYVFNREPHPVMVFDRDGNLRTWWGERLYKRAHGIYVGPDGSVYCADDGNHTVSKYTPEGELLLVLGNTGQPSNTGYMKKTGLHESLATIKRGSLPFNRPTDIFIHNEETVYVTS